MREAFGTEQGDEFMSLVYALDAEARGKDSVWAQAAGGELEWMLSGHATVPFVEPAPRVEHLVPFAARPVVARRRLVPVAAAPPPPARPNVVPLPVRPAASEPTRPAAEPESAPSPRPPLRPSTLVDDLTGIGGPLALKRDVMLESSLPTPGGPRFALISIDVHPMAEVLRRRGEAVADQLFKTLVDAVRVSLRPSDGIYRSGPDELTLLLRGRTPGAGDQARAELEVALRQAWADRRLPLVRLATATEGPRPAAAERQAAAV
jgi:GGDEF domain-containing protein